MTILVFPRLSPGSGPALGDGDAWAARIAQGMDTPIDHALQGFSGTRKLIHGHHKIGELCEPFAGFGCTGRRKRLPAFNLLGQLLVYTLHI